MDYRDFDSISAAPRVVYGETLYDEMRRVQEAPAGPCTPECAQQTRELAVCACLLAVGMLLLGGVLGWALHGLQAAGAAGGGR